MAIEVKRQPIELTPDERATFERLSPVSETRPKIVRDFWDGVATKRGLDPATILANALNAPTALALGHGKHWNWPSDLRCKRAPRYLIEREAK